MISDKLKLFFGKKEKKLTHTQQKVKNRQKSDNLHHICYDTSPIKLYFIDSFSNCEIKWSEMLSAKRFGCVNMAAIILLPKKNDA